MGVGFDILSDFGILKEYSLSQNILFKLGFSKTKTTWYLKNKEKVLFCYEK